ncbi:MAG: hypothetical protein J6P02_03020 [Lachnospiraceae bacterium]|nr:hypothetical protein [Lachnospiraceae bacterium]
MADNIFRKHNLEHLSSPEAIDDYLKVTSIKLWVVLLAIFMLLIAFVAWANFYKIKDEVIDEKGSVSSSYITPISLIKDTHIDEFYI